MKKIIKVLIVGSGEMSHAYAKVIKNLPKLCILSVVSKNFKNAKEFAKKYNIRAFKTLEEAKVFGAPEIVIVSVSATQLINVIKTLLIYKNSTIFLEKPIGINYKENKKIIKLLKNKKNFYPLLNRRFYQSTIHAKKILDKNKNEKRYIIINNYHNFLNGPKNGFIGKNIKYWPYMNSIHLLDFLFIFGRSKITSCKKILDEKFQNNKRILIYKFNFRSGDVAIYNTHYNFSGFWSVTIHFNDQTLELKPLESLVLKKNNVTKKINLSNIDILYKPGLHNMINNLILKKSTNPLFNINIMHTKKIMKLINLIYKI